MRIGVVREVGAVTRGIACLGIAAIVLGLTVPLFPSERVSATSPAATPDTAASPRDLTSLQEATVSAAPFRPDRTPVTARFDPLAAEAPPETDVPRPKPVLRLRGLVWGAHPVAIVEGLPEARGPHVVSQGDRVGDLTIRTLSPTGVVVIGMDTTWTLTLYEPWGS